MFRPVVPEAAKKSFTMSYCHSEDRGVFANILLDKWFKRAFKEYGNAKRLMLLFLQALIPEREIVSIDYASEESTNQNPDGKSIRVDVECYDVNGQRFVVEVQQGEQHYFYDRAVFNSTFAVQRQLQEGIDSYRFQPVYFIGIMRFSLHEDSERFLYRYMLTEEESGEKMTDDLHYIFLEVPKCRLRQGSSLIEKIGYVLDNLSSLEEKPAELDGEIFDLLFLSANLSNFTPEDKIKYQNDVTTDRDIRNQIAFAQDKGYAQGIRQGREEGEAKGMEIGMEKGIAQGKVEIAKAMLSQGFAVSTIVELTGLTPEEVEALSKG
jgi:predicted transposase/invertase (TIGR01784 family)